MKPSLNLNFRMIQFSPNLVSFPRLWRKAVSRDNDIFAEIFFHFYRCGSCQGITRSISCNLVLCHVKVSFCPLWSPSEFGKFFFQISSKAYHLYAILCTDYERHVYISFRLSFVYEKDILPPNRLYGAIHPLFHILVHL